MKPIKNTKFSQTYVWTHPSAHILRKPNGAWVRFGDVVEVEEFKPCHLQTVIADCPGCVRIVGSRTFQCINFGDTTVGYGLRKFKKGGQ